MNEKTSDVNLWLPEAYAYTIHVRMKGWGDTVHVGVQEQSKAREGQC